MIGQKGIPATYGGVERHVEELAARLVGMGHEVTAYCRRHYTPEGTEHRGIKLRIQPSINTKHLDAVTHAFLAAADAVRRDFDLVHFHAIGPAALSFIPRMLFWQHRAVVATVHSLDWKRPKWGPLARGCLRLGAGAAVRFPHRTICVSRRIAEHFASRDLVHIPNGVAPARREPLQELRKHGIDRGGFIFWIGRFVPEKRVEDLIAAYRKLRPEQPLLLAGEVDESDPYVHALKAAAGDDPNIIFTGGLYERAKAEAFTHAGLVVQPSEMEGFPIVLLEAMRYGRPILASDIPEQLEAVEPGVNGFVFRMGDVESLRKNLAWALRHPQELAAAGRRAESDARRYDWDAIAGQTAEVYEEALAAARA